MENFDLTKYLAEGKLLKEALNKPLNQLGPAIEKKLKAAGMEVKIIPGKTNVPGDAREAISKNPKLAAAAFGTGDGTEFMEIVVNSEKLKDLEKIRDYFNVPSGAYGPDKDAGWVIKNVRNVNPGDIIASKAEKIGDLGFITFTRAAKADDNSKGMLGTQSIKTKNKMAAEGKLHEALDPQDVVDIADTVAEEFTKESADKGDFMVYSVGELDSADMSFELDTDTTAQTPERILNMSNLGVGEGWGGNFRINPKEEGYEVRNAEKGGLVAIIDNMGNFKMLSADESRAEMGRTKGEETDYMKRRRETDDYMQEGEEKKSNKMKKSELKEMIKAAMMAETSVEETLVDADQDMAEAILNALGGEAAFEAVVRAMSTDDAQVYLGGIMRDYDIEMGSVGDVPGFEGTMDALDALSIREEEDDIEAEIEADDEEVDVDVDMDMGSDAEGIDVKQDADTDLGGTVGDVQDNLEAALAAARELGDEKLEDQIGNTLTFFTRQHVVKEGDLELDVNADETGVEAELGLEESATESLNESSFPMWNKIK